MCGIFAYVGNSNVDDAVFDACLSSIQRRGPDAQQTFHATLSLPRGDKSAALNVWLSASVLAIRGDAVVPQPLVDAHHVLLWNGEIFSGLAVPPHDNDTTFLFDALGSCGTEAELLMLMSRIRGPFAFVYFQRTKHKIWFGRDVLGRRSLLWHVPVLADGAAEMGPRFALCSTDIYSSKVPGYFTDVSPSGIYCVDLERLASAFDAHPSVELFPWGSMFLPHPIARLALSPSLDVVPAMFSTLLRQAVYRRACTIDAHHRMFCESQPALTPCRVALLFSGGLDSTVLAAILDSVLAPGEPIDLLNVSFENMRYFSASLARVGADVDVFESVPDRQSGLRSLDELKRLNPSRDFRLIRINVARSELIEHQDRIRTLMSPNDSVLDWSIAAPFYFCGRARGQLHLTAEARDAPASNYTSQAKVLMVGFGADELLGGYGRHRMRYEQAGWKGVRSEMMLDFERMWARNLGRDDRCLSEFGRESRLPFLDEDLVSFLQSVPLSALMDFSLARGLGEKLILRNLARNEFSLHYSAGLPKRAIQFGSKIAKMDHGTRHQQAAHPFEPYAV